MARTRRVKTGSGERHMARYPVVAVVLGAFLGLSCPAYTFGTGWSTGCSSRGLSTMQRYWHVDEEAEERFNVDMRDCQATYSTDYVRIERCMVEKGWVPT